MTGFAELAHVSEFVRRAYVASAGGDGSDAPGGPEVQPPPQGPDGSDRADVPPFIDGEVLEALGRFGLRDAVEVFNMQSVEVSALSLAAPMAFKPSWDSIHAGAAGTAMARGARHLLAELLDRCPDRADPEALLRWDDDLRGLGFFARRCHVLEALAEDDQTLMERVDSTIHRLCGIRWEPEDRSVFDAITVLLAAPHLLRTYPIQFRYWRTVARELGPFGNWPLGEVDTVDSLARWPAPSCTQVLGAEESAGRCSALAMLSAVTSAPQALSQLSVEGMQVAIDVAVFASACLTSSEEPGPSLQHHWFYRNEWSDTITQKCAHRAMDWLVTQLPRLGFGVELEQRISAARHLTYGKATPTVSSTPTPPFASGAAQV